MFNTPLDLLIERRLHAERPALRPAQLLSLHRLAAEAAAATFRPEIRQITPPSILRLAGAYNGLAALFLDDLSDGATDAFAPYAALDTAATARHLWSRWQELAPAWSPGSEYTWVDEFAEHLGVRAWFAWQPDPGPGATPAAGSAAPPFPEPDLSATGTSNPELLRRKHPAAVWFLLDALNRFAALSPAQIHALTLEVARLGEEGLDYASADKKYVLRAFPAEEFSGLHLLCFLFAGLKRLAPAEDPGIDLEAPFAAALEEFHRREGQK